MTSFHEMSRGSKFVCPDVARRRRRREQPNLLRMARDYYDVLDVPRSADPAAIKSAFRKAARKYHPDVNSAPDAQQRFQEVQKAYEILSDPEKRSRYDRFGEAGVSGAGPGPTGGVEVNLEDIFDSFFGGGGGARGARRRSGPTQGDDLRADLEISFETACFGGRERVRIQHLETCDTCRGSGVKPGAKVRTCGTCGGSGVVMQVTRTPLGNFQTQTTCPTCRGTGQSVDEYCSACAGQGVQRKSKQVTVNIPCGVDDGVKLRVAGEGDAGAKGGPAGDLYIFLAVKPDPQLKRDGVDVFSDITVDVADAILGSSKPTRTLDEASLLVDIPPGTQPGAKIKLPGKGVPQLNKKTQRGDHYVTVNVKIPKQLSSKAKELVEQLKRETKGL